MHLGKSRFNHFSSYVRLESNTYSVLYLWAKRSHPLLVKTKRVLKLYYKCLSPFSGTQLWVGHICYDAFTSTYLIRRGSYFAVCVTLSLERMVYLQLLWIWRRPRLRVDDWRHSDSSSPILCLLWICFVLHMVYIVTSCNRKRIIRLAQHTNLDFFEEQFGDEIYCYSDCGLWTSTYLGGVEHWAIEGVCYQRICDNCF